MAKIPKGLSDTAMMQGHEGEETLLRREQEAEERARRAAAKEPPADLARAGLSAAQTEELGRALMELKLTLAQEQVTNYKLKIKRSGRQVIITAT